MQARNRTLQQEHDARAWLAWHTAFLGRVKEFPELHTLQGKRKQVRRQSQEELAANLKRIFKIGDEHGQ